MVQDLLIKVLCQLCLYFPSYIDDIKFQFLKCINTNMSDCLIFGVEIFVEIGKLNESRIPSIINLFKNIFINQQKNEKDLILKFKVYKFTD